MRIQVMIWEAFGGIICTIKDGNDTCQLGQSPVFHKDCTEQAVASAIENMIRRLTKREPLCREHFPEELQMTDRIVELEEKLAAAETLAESNAKALITSEMDNIRIAQRLVAVKQTVQRLLDVGAHNLNVNQAMAQIQQAANGRTEVTK